ncbi:hypothetical protein EDD11_006241 [Mortierella claussenii]|nr:hypothetical protein EDD11_006241 [Mortierella claussenii]
MADQVLQRIIHNSVSKRSSSSSASSVSADVQPFVAATSRSTETTAQKQSTWLFPQASEPAGRHVPSIAHHGPLPLPIALKAFKPYATITQGSAITATSQLLFPPPPAVLGSHPLYYLAKRFPILAEQELKSIPNRTAQDYASFIIGAMSTSFPSATTLRAVVRQFRNFLKESSSSALASTNAKRMELPRTRIWAQTIRGLIWLRQHRRARVAIHVMQKFGIKPTGFAWRGICRGWIQQGELKMAEALATQVFLNPKISHDYKLDERPYYLHDMPQSTSDNHSSSSAESAARRRHRSPMSPNSAPLFLVIEAWTECGEMEKARYWFDRVPEHEMTDMLTSDMVAGYLRVGQQDKAQEVIRIMARCGVKPTAIVFNPIVEHALKTSGMEAAEDLVKDMEQLGIFLNLFTFKILIRGYIAAGDKVRVLACLQRMRALGIETDRALGRILLEGLWGLGEIRLGDHGPAAVAESEFGATMKDELLKGFGFVSEPGWSARCIEWIKQGEVEQAEEVLQHVLALEDPRMNNESVQVIGALADHHEMTRARHWFDRLLSITHHMQIQDQSMIVGLMNDMVSRYLKMQQPSEAEAVIESVAQRGALPNVETVNLMLQWMTLRAEMSDAENLVQKTAQSGITPNQQTFEILSQGYAARGEIESLQRCLSRMEEMGFVKSTWSLSTLELQSAIIGPHSEESQSSPSSLSTGILDTLCKRWIEQDQMAKAEQFLGQLSSNPNVPPHNIPYTTLIQGWIDQSQRITVSSSAIQAMGPSHSDDDPSTSQLASSSVSTSQSLNQERRLHQESIVKMRKARSWFDRIPESERTLQLVNRMIGGYMALDLEHEAEELIQWMATQRIKPDVETYNHILKHTIQSRAMGMPAAEVIVSKMQKGGIAPNVETWNLLVRGYVIRGELTRALRCLDRMAGKKDASSSSSSLALAQRLDVRGGKSRSRAREIMKEYDSEILDVVVGDEEEEVNSNNTATAAGSSSWPSSRSTSSSSSSWVSSIDAVYSTVAVKPNETTQQLILSGFGPEVKPVQGQGDYARALALFRNRVARQKQQEDQLLQGLAALNQQQQPLQGRQGFDEENEEGDEWILDHLEMLQGLAGGSEVGMTDMDWKNELQWEEMMEMERERERELSGSERKWFD